MCKTISNIIGSLLILFASLYASNANAVDLVLDGSKTMLSGTECGLATYRFGTQTSYSGKQLDLIMEVTEEDNDYVGPCVQLTGNQVSLYLKDTDAGDNVAYMDLKFTVVEKGTRTPVPVDRILVTNFDLDSNGDPYYSLSDDVYYKDADGAYISSNSAVQYSEGSFYGKYNVKMRGKTSGDCNDGTTTTDVTCRAAAIWINGENGPNTVSTIYARAQNDNAYGTYAPQTAMRLIQFSFELVHFQGLVTAGTDYGDAPNSYGSTGHKTDVNIGLGHGEIADSEAAHQGSDNADADDKSTNGFDDENAVFLNEKSLDGQTLNAETTENLSILTFGSGYLNAWIDWNRDGDFNDANEQIINKYRVSTTSVATNTIPLDIPGSMVSGKSFMRVRFSTDSNVGPSGYSSSPGEVEDYMVVLAVKDYDYGDAPDGLDIFNYGVAKHVMNGPSKLGIGRNKPEKDSETEVSSWKSDWDGKMKGKHKGWFDKFKKNNKSNERSPIEVTDGDGEEEDGLTKEKFIWKNAESCSGLMPDGTHGTINMDSQTFCLELEASNESNVAAQLVAWVDFDNNGVFDDPAERSVVNVDADPANDATQGNVPAGTSNEKVVVYWNNLSEPVDEVSTFIRMRLTTDPAFKSNHSPDPIAVATDGEVEDSAITLKPYSSLEVQTDNNL